MNTNNIIKLKYEILIYLIIFIFKGVHACEELMQRIRGYMYETFESIHNINGVLLSENKWSFEYMYRRFECLHNINFRVNISNV